MLTSIIFRYVTRHLLQVVCAVTFMMLIVIMCGRFVNYLARAASGQIQSEVLFQLILWRLPEFLVLVLPFGLCIGIVLSYGRLHANNELVILQSIGISRLKLLLMAMVPSGFIMVLVAWLSLFGAPLGLYKVSSILSSQDALTGLEMLVPGRFQVLDKGKRMLYVESISKHNKQWRNVFAVSKSADETSKDMTLLFADFGEMGSNEEGEQYIIFRDGGEHVLKAGQTSIRTTRFKAYGTRIKNEKSKKMAVSDGQALPTKKLFGKTKPELVAELQWRLAIPFMIPILVIMAIALAGINPRQGQFSKLLPMVLIYLIYLVMLMVVKGYMENDEIENSQFFANSGMWLVHMVFLILAWVGYNYRPLKILIRKWLV